MDSNTNAQPKFIKLTIEEIVPLADIGNDDILKTQACLISSGRHEQLIRDGMLRIVKAEVVVDEEQTDSVVNKTQ